MIFTRGASSDKTLNAVDVCGYKATAPTLNNGATITNLYAFYDPGMDTAGVTSPWGFHGLSANHFLEALQIGGTPTVGMGSGTLSVTGVTTLSDDLVMPATSGKGIRIYDATTPDFGWRDITADIQAGRAGAANPTWTSFITNINAYRFTAVNDEIWINFHIPHDYVPGSDIYIHTHWGLIVANSTDTITWGFNASYASRNDVTLDTFPSTTNTTVSHDCSAVTIPQYGHVVSEVVLSASGAMGGNTLEVDGVVLCRVYLSADAGNTDPYLFFCDIHYQSNNLATKDKAPNFYT
jgi:hypothetical protein